MRGVLGPVGLDGADKIGADATWSKPRVNSPLVGESPRALRPAAGELGRGCRALPAFRTRALSLVVPADGSQSVAVDNELPNVARGVAAADGESVFSRIPGRPFRIGNDAPGTRETKGFGGVRRASTHHRELLVSTSGHGDNSGKLRLLDKKVWTQ